MKTHRVADSLVVCPVSCTAPFPCALFGNRFRQFLVPRTWPLHVHHYGPTKSISMTPPGPSVWPHQVHQYGPSMSISMAPPCPSAWPLHVHQYGPTRSISMAPPCPSAWPLHVRQYGPTRSISMAQPCPSVKPVLENPIFVNRVLSLFVLFSPFLCMCLVSF